ncbi:F0F1 ATP synthase subunit A [Phycisphaeraceae bacterium AH-315-B13]|nr:F0F1 ATP synthase subunit A [Phycisphaeraceae bacterium AH-315-B13]PHQ79872.1 MAG: ATP synthase F0 subunit A [Phycisphaera sp.]
MSMMDVSLSLAEGVNPIDHVVNHAFFTTESGIWVWSAHTGNLVLSGIICIFIGRWAASRIATGDEGLGNERYVTKNSFAHMLEVICVYLRENTVRPLLHERTDKFMPFLWTMFFFILINNLLGLVPILDLLYVVDELGGGFMGLKGSHTTPIGGTATQNIYVTAALAFIAFVVINGAGIKRLGIGGYLGHLTGGAPKYIWPLMILVEALGIFIKPVALAIRLFANMTAGHVLVATLFMFVGAASQAGIVAFLGVGSISTIAVIAIYFLEIFISFLQAFVFMFLVTVFIAQLDHHHDEEHGAVPAH